MFKNERHLDPDCAVKPGLQDISKEQINNYSSGSSINMLIAKSGCQVKMKFVGIVKMDASMSHSLGAMRKNITCFCGPPMAPYAVF